VALTGIRIRFKYFSLPVFLFIVCYNAHAQYETANWIFSEYILSFVNENPVASYPVVNSMPAAFASYSSDVGKLLIATDGSTVWNGNGEVMKNGENITSYRTNSIIIPKPGSDN
jgi:hypothetical protein